jgi:hypothetical protein
MTDYNYYVRGMCVGISLAGRPGVFEKCECSQTYKRNNNCSACLKTRTLQELGVTPVGEGELELQLNSTSGG